MERREHQRVKPSQQQRFTLQIQDLTFDIRPGDISPGGLFIKAGVLFPVGAMLAIELAYAQTSATCQARVQHRGKDGVGLAFVNPSEKFADLVRVATDLIDSTAG